MNNDILISILLVVLIALTAMEFFMLGVYHQQKIAERSSAYIDETWQTLPRETER